MSSGEPILYVNPTAVHGGAEEALYAIMTAAQDLSYRPVLVVPRQGWLTDHCQQRDIPFEVASVIPDTFTTTTWREQLKPWLPSAASIARLARKWKVVMVHSNTPRVSYHGGLGARLAGVAAVTHVHDIIRTPYASPPQAKLLSRLADWILVPSQAVRDVVVDAAPQLRSRIQVLYNGWDLSVYAGVQPADVRAMFGLASDAVVIGNVAAMHPWKGQDLLIEAFRQLREEVPQAHLVIVGGAQGGKSQSEYETKLHRSVADLGLEGVVTFAGWREDVWSLIQGFDIFVHVPAQPDPLPTAVIHAAALKSAIVASAIGGIPEIVQDGVGGVLVPPGDAETLCRALAMLIADPRRRALLGEHAHAHFVDRFSRAQLVDGLAEAYRSCFALRRK